MLSGVNKLMWRGGVSLLRRSDGGVTLSPASLNGSIIRKHPHTHTTQQQTEKQASPHHKFAASSTRFLLYKHIIELY
jgi:hypothetical protein